MNINKIMSAVLITTAAGVSVASGAASDGYGQGGGNHFRSPPTLSSAVAEESDSPKVAMAPKPAKTSKATVNEDPNFPPSAKPGECYTRVVAPTPMRQVTERVKIKDESVRLIEVPAVLEEVDEKVVVRSATQRQEVVPATYKEVEENILIAPAYIKRIPVPARYETRTERVMVQPERSYWKKGSGPLAKIDHTTGEIMCYVTDPAVYEEVKHTDLVAPATVREEQVPATYKTVKRTVIDRPASIKTIDIPAEYGVMKVSKVKTEAKVERQVVPAEYRNVVKQVPNGESKMEWRRVLCDTNTDAALIADMQTALNKKGHKAGEADGKLNKQTLKALEEFQIANNLATGGVTYESLNALGMDI